MLNAIKNGKSGHSIDGSDIPWRELFRGSEDSLTSAIFERLFYLSNDSFWQILLGAIPGLRIEPCPIQVVEFWPHWSAVGTRNENFVEPDVFMRTEKFDLIVEAKKKGAGQNEGQWRNEITSYRSTFGEHRSCFFIAIEGSEGVTSEEIEGVPVLKTSWQSLLDSVSRNLNILESEGRATLGEVQIHKDLITGFGIHGYVMCSWFEDFKKVQIITEEISFFKQITFIS